MPGPCLTNARIAALAPRKASYDIRDGKLRGFDVRVMPSGRKRFFVHCQHQGERIWKIVGDAGAMDSGEARSLAGTVLAAIHRGEAAPIRPEEALFEAVAETVFHQHERLWKLRQTAMHRDVAMAAARVEVILENLLHLPHRQPSCHRTLPPFQKRRQGTRGKHESSDRNRPARAATSTEIGVATSDEIQVVT